MYCKKAEKQSKRKTGFSPKSLFVCAVSLFLIAIGCCLYSFIVADSANEVDSASKNTKKKLIKRTSRLTGGAAAVREAMGGAAKNTNHVPRKRMRTDVDIFANMQPADRKLAVAVQESLDKNDFNAVVEAVNAALKSTNPEVRENAVEALGWFGAEALPELTPLMSDVDADIAEAASSHWQLALSEIEDDGLRAKIAEAALPSISDENTIHLVISEITSQDDQFQIMQSLVNLIDCGRNRVVNAAKEEYESLTGEPWSGIDAAEVWLDENYEPEEPEE
jgi:hypothetical protein